MMIFQARELQKYARRKYHLLQRDYLIETPKSEVDKLCIKVFKQALKQEKDGKSGEEYILNQIYLNLSKDHQNDDSIYMWYSILDSLTWILNRETPQLVDVLKRSIKLKDSIRNEYDFTD